MKKAQEFMTPEEIAKEMRVTVPTVHRWCRAGLGKRYGHIYRITRAELEEWGRQQEVGV